jgi:hypothetical protein
MLLSIECQALGPLVLIPVGLIALLAWQNGSWVGVSLRACMPELHFPES